MQDFLNKNLFKLVFLFLIFTELLSFFSWFLPEFGNICFFVILFLCLILSLKKLEYGLYILFAELFIGSKGYLFSLEFGETLVSIRIGLFLVIMAVFLSNVILRSDATKDLLLKITKNRFFASLRTTLFFLCIVILWGFIVGLINHNNFGDIFLDFNNWLYFLLILPVWHVARESDEFIKNILSVLTACVIWIGIKSLILLYIFSHQFIWALPETYKWIRDTLVGEITRAPGGFYRIFIQSQINSLFFFFILLPISKKISNFKFQISKYLLLIISLTTIILSFSRSYWVAFIITLLFYYFVVLLNKIKFLDFLKLNAKILLLTLASFVIIFLVMNFPPKTEQGNLVDLFGKRATEVEAAASSRINQLKPLLLEIAKHPIIGSGFGTTITYKSNDPRILGDYTTYAFEWGYLDMILKFGLLGTIIYLILIIRILQCLLISNFKFLISKQIGLGLALVALLIVNIFSPYLNHPLGIGFVILSSIIAYEK